MDSGFCVYGFMAWDELPHAPLPARPRARVSVIRLARTRVGSPGWHRGGAGQAHTLGSGRARPAELPRRARCGAARLAATGGSWRKARETDVAGPTPRACGAGSGGARGAGLVSDRCSEGVLRAGRAGFVQGEMPGVAPPAATVDSRCAGRRVDGITRLVGARCAGNARILKGPDSTTPAAVVLTVRHTRRNVDRLCRF